jgi:hypothetical protein
VATCATPRQIASISRRCAVRSGDERGRRCASGDPLVSGLVRAPGGVARQRAFTTHPEVFVSVSTAPAPPRPKAKASDRLPAAASTAVVNDGIRRRALLVLSLLDQRADGAKPSSRLTHTAIATGLSRYCTDFPTSRSTVTRLLQGGIAWSPAYLRALARYAMKFGLHVDPGWIAFGIESGAEAPELPRDCMLRPDADPRHARAAQRTLRAILLEERERWGTS